MQARQRCPSSWWTAANAEHMLALRMSRANREWDTYWAWENNITFAA